MSRLFSEIQLRGLVARNRIGVSPMCQYSSIDGMPNDWHLVHLGSRAAGGAGLVLTEAAAISPEGRISPLDLGIWNDEQAQALARINGFVSAQGAVPGVQLAHAGRKASTCAPWDGDGSVPINAGGWQPIAPSSTRFSDTYPEPRAMNHDDIRRVVEQFSAAAVRSISAGFRIIELHMAHGYLVHQFLSPLSNSRADDYGGAFDNRIRIAVQIVEAVRQVIPKVMPLAVRLSCTDWVEGGWDIAQTVELVRRLQPLGVDLVDCSSGGVVPGAKIPVGPGYQTAFAERIRRETGVAVATVGLITSPEQAEHTIVTGQADMVLLAREFLRSPYWPLHAAKQLRADVAWPKQYARGKS